MKKSVMAAIGSGIIVTIIVSLWLVQIQPATIPTQTSDQNQPIIEQTEVAVSKIKVIASFYPLYEFTKNV
ncbi:MAG TPA: hypothetical protein VGA92_06900, partial [Candidatus Nitrosotenuis sp.]